MKMKRKTQYVAQLFIAIVASFVLRFFDLESFSKNSKESEFQFSV